MTSFLEAAMQPDQDPYATPQAPLDDLARSDEKGPRNLEVVTGAIQSRGEYHCLLTGRAAQIVPVVLRRMLITPVGWIGYKATVGLPLSKTPFLVFWQYVRMLRPWATFALPFYLMHVMTEERDRWGSPLGKLPPSVLMIVGWALPIGSAIGLWIGLGMLLKRFEFVRLLYIDTTDGFVKIRFSKPGLARRASEVLVLFKRPVS
jgi:hypothetical protein